MHFQTHAQAPVHEPANTCTCTRAWDCRHVHMHPCMRLQTRAHAHIRETVLKRRFQFTGKLYYTHKVLHKIRQHSQLGKSKKGLSFRSGERQKQTATDSHCQFISINVKLAGVEAGTPHLQHQLSIKTLSSLAHKLLLSGKKKFQKKTSLENGSRMKEATAGMWQPFSGMEDLLHHPFSQHGHLLALTFSSADVQIPIMCH